MILVTRNGKEEGPYSEEEVRKRLISHRLAVNDLARLEGNPEWAPLVEVLNLRELLDFGARATRKRPVLVWVISLVYMPITVLMLLFSTWALLGISPFTEKFKSENAGEPVGIMLSASSLYLLATISALTLVAVVMLYRLRKMAFYLLIAAFGAGFVSDIQPMVTNGWRAELWQQLATIICWMIHVGIILYTERLISKGILT